MNESAGKMNMNINKQVEMSDIDSSISQSQLTNICDAEQDSNCSIVGGASRTSCSIDILQKAVEKSLKRVTSQKRVLPYFKEHFKKVYRADSGNVIEIFKSMMRQLESMIMEEIQMQLNASSCEELLNNLDKVKLESISTQRKWRPSGNPREDIKAHLQETSQKELKQLEKTLKTLESQNKYLNESVAKSDDKLQASIKMVEKYCLNWEEAALVLSDETRQELIDINMNLPSMTI